METIIAIAIVLVAFGWVVRSLVRALRGKGGSNCSSGGCGSCSCSDVSKKLAEYKARHKLS